MKVRFILSFTLLFSFLSLVRAQGQSANDYYLTAVMHLMGEEFQEALVELDKAINIQPENGELYNKRAKAKAGIGDERGALDDLDKAIKFNPKDSEALNLRGNLNANFNRYDLAIIDFTQALEADPQSYKNLNNRANCFKKMKRYKDAIDDYTGFLAYSDQYHLVFSNRAYCHQELGHYQEAIADYQKAIELENTNAIYHFNAGYNAYMLEDYVLACRFFTKSKQLGFSISEEDLADYCTADDGTAIVLDETAEAEKVTDANPTQATEAKDEAVIENAGSETYIEEKRVVSTTYVAPDSKSSVDTVIDKVHIEVKEEEVNNAKKEEVKEETKPLSKKELKAQFKAEKARLKAEKKAAKKK